MIEYEVKSCPFCGMYPQVTLGAKRGCQLHGEPMQGVFVRCANPKCSVKPNTYEYGNVHDDKAGAVYLAVSNWNNRLCTQELKKREFKL